MQKIQREISEGMFKESFVWSPGGISAWTTERSHAMEEFLKKNHVGIPLESSNGIHGAIFEKVIGAVRDTYMILWTNF